MLEYTGSIDPELIMIGERLRGVPVVHAGRSWHGADCAGGMQLLYGARGVRFPLPDSYPLEWFRGDRTPGLMLWWIEKQLGWPARSQIAVGDLILFRFFTTHYGDHPGVYLGDGLFLHALSGRWLISRLSDTCHNLTWAERAEAGYRPTEVLACPQQSPSSPAPPSGPSLRPSRPRFLSPESPRSRPAP